MKYLVTGGAGFIGSHLVSHLVSRGDEVIVVDNFSTGKRENLRGLDAHVIDGDIRDIHCLKEAMRGVDTVFHQAALCSVARSVADPISTHEVNATGTLNVLEASHQSGVRRVVFASSSSVYGDSEHLPKDESMPPAPRSPYAISKLMTEYYGKLYADLHGLETVPLRYFNVFGPRQDPNSEYAAVIPKFIDGILDDGVIEIHGDGLQTRDFTYVDNVVQANLLAAHCSVARGQPINVACGRRWSLLDLVIRLESILGCKARKAFRDRRAGDVKHSQASLERAITLLDYSPSVGFDEGLERTAQWFVAPRKSEEETGQPVPACAGTG